MFDIDIILLQYINNFAGRYFWLDAAGIFFAEYAEYVLLGSLAIFLLVHTKKYWPMVWRAFAAAILSRFIIAEVTRFFLHRPRPFIEQNVNLLVLGENPYNSFPSGHATFYFALATVIYLYNKKLGLIFFAAAFLISLARVFAGVHWPTDILGGAVIGIACGWLVCRVFKR